MDRHDSSYIYSKAKFKGNHRYILKRTWNKDKEMVTIIMSNPTDADALRFDKSLMIAMNYFVNAGYGGFYIVNLFSRIANSNQELLKVKYKNRYDKRTDRWIKFAIKNSSNIYIGWGVNENKVKRVKRLTLILGDCGIESVYKIVNKGGNPVHMSRLTKEIKKEKIHIKDI